MGSQSITSRCQLYLSGNWLLISWCIFTNYIPLCECLDMIFFMKKIDYASLLQDMFAPCQFDLSVHIGMFTCCIFPAKSRDRLFCVCPTPKAMTGSLPEAEASWLCWVGPWADLSLKTACLFKRIGLG